MWCESMTLCAADGRQGVSLSVCQTERGSQRVDSTLTRKWSGMSPFRYKCHFIIAGRLQSIWNSNAVPTTLGGQVENILGLAEGFLGS